MTTKTLDPTGLMRMMTWFGPFFPVGSYTYSHGIEYAVEDGRVTDGKSLVNWIEGILLFGAGRIDGGLFAQTYGAAENDDVDALVTLGVMADCWRATSEMALESTAQGRAFVSSVGKVWGDGLLAVWAARLRDDSRLPSYPLAVAIAAAEVGVPLIEALSIFLHASVANLVSVAVRLVPLGQTDGVRALAVLEKTVLEASAIAVGMTADNLGACAPLIDWTSMRHETQYTRLFRS